MIAIIVGVTVAISSSYMVSRDDEKKPVDDAAVQAPVLEQVASMVSDDGQPAEERAMDKRLVLGYTMSDIDGESVDLGTYTGKVVLMVNTASECGLTPQYAGLEKLYRAHKDAGFVILGFPANNFGAQEPGSDKDIHAFCTETYDVTFPMFSKISVTGDDAHPLYQQLTSLSEAPNWNFTKYLVDREGHFVARFEPQTTPDDVSLGAKIELLLETN